MDAFDVYLVHAGEDGEPASCLASRLSERGLRVWFNSFTPGLRLRQQMEDGLRRSTFGAVLVTTALFKKKWAVEELDALMSLETATDGVRIIPIWLGVSAKDVTELSPMMAARSAVRVHGFDEQSLRIAADETLEAVLRLAADRSPAQWLRSQITVGLRWLHPPGFLPHSFAFLDDHFDAGYRLATFDRFPTPPRPGSAGAVRPPVEFLISPTTWDGTEITAIGRQTPGTLQVLTEHDVLLGEHDGNPVKLASWIFQLNSPDLSEHHTIYVHLCGPSSQGLRPDVPPDWVMWVTGVPVAYGSVMTLTGRGANCLYIAARAIYSHPAVGQ